MHPSPPNSLALELGGPSPATNNSLTGHSHEFAPLALTRAKRRRFMTDMDGADRVQPSGTRTASHTASLSGAKVIVQG